MAIPCVVVEKISGIPDKCRGRRSVPLGEELAEVPVDGCWRLGERECTAVATELVVVEAVPEESTLVACRARIAGGLVESRSILSAHRVVPVWEVLAAMTVTGDME